MGEAAQESDVFQEIKDTLAASLREPPHSTEAEQSVLGGLLQDNAAWEKAASIVCAGDFYTQAHGAIFATIGTLIAAGRPADVITVHEELQRAHRGDDFGGLAYLNSLEQSVPTARNLHRYAEIVREHSVRRETIGLCDEISTAAFAQEEPSRLLARAVCDLSRIESRAGVASGVPLLPLAELRERHGLTSWLVKSIVPSVSIGALFGASQTFKSFAALDLGLHVAHGLRWMGRRTAQGSVIYVAAEGGAGLWRRVDAWHRCRSLSWDKLPFFVVPEAVDLSVDAQRIVMAAKRVGVTPALIVVDTLSQTYAGDENSANEMAAYLRHLGQQFRDLWSCAVLLVHHAGHSATERPRGSSALGANVDFLLGMHRDEREMLATMSCQKTKDAEPFADASFQLKRVELGTDSDGDAVSSLVAWHLASDEEIAEAAQAEQAAGRSGRFSGLLSLVENGMAEKVLRKAFYDLLGDAPTDTKKKAFYRARDRAIELRQIEVAEGFVIDLRGKR